MRSRNQNDLVPAFLCIRWAKCRFVLAQGSAFGECTSSSCQARWCTKYTNRVGVSLLDCAKGRWRGCNNLICFVALTTPMSLLGRKLCQQWLPQLIKSRFHSAKALIPKMDSFFSGYWLHYIIKSYLISFMNFSMRSSCGQAEPVSLGCWNLYCPSIFLQIFSRMSSRSVFS